MIEYTRTKNFTKSTFQTNSAYYDRNQKIIAKFPVNQLARYILAQDIASFSESDQKGKTRQRHLWLVVTHYSSADYKDH